MDALAPNSLTRLLTEYQQDKRQWLNLGTPWTTEGSKSWLARNIGPTDRALEFGAGRSTVFWARQAGKVTVVEGSPDWTFWTLFYLYEHPHLMKKVRWHFCPTEWNPDFPKGARRYWTENRGSLDANDVTDLERDLASVSFSGNNVVLFDGNIRKHVFLYQVAQMNFDEVEVIVIDNCENMWTSETAGALIRPDFERLDFVAGPLDDVPSHQKGKHITSVFVRKDRFARSVHVKTHVSPKMDLETRKKYMQVVEGFDVDAQISDGYRYLSETLGLDVGRR
ncbi:hypothetical protein IB276_26290 [Ensifer sp. ENS04]|uniref:hypothetical protein n=1 Tax=Ensifer sp. ENS04 TaxID=2769281 RepID=UPI00177D56D3|nr:hypothetical protein [Ensifer sp. ENS04]MBD9542960.1 hypothetical protein [Ensifer sp. ENS04]